uniref:Uncharacterized protein n=1 Tax=Thermocrispum agreste TaxID=37925 RepID=A0A2W4JAX6_9PSEU|nr:MAG: hypothetical protein DIU77_10815 [Thermocrispum agreste]
MAVTNRRKPRLRRRRARRPPPRRAARHPRPARLPRRPHKAPDRRASRQSSRAGHRCFPRGRVRRSTCPRIGPWKIPG